MATPCTPALKLLSFFVYFWNSNEGRLNIQYVPISIPRGELIGCGPGLAPRQLSMMGRLCGIVDHFSITWPNRKFPWISKKPLQSSHVTVSLAPVLTVEDWARVTNTLDRCTLIPRVQFSVWNWPWILTRCSNFNFWSPPFWVHLQPGNGPVLMRSGTGSRQPKWDPWNQSPGVIKAYLPTVDIKTVNIKQLFHPIPDEHNLSLCGTSGMPF